MQRLMTFIVLFCTNLVFSDSYDPELMFLSWEKDPNTTMVVTWISDIHRQESMIQVKDQENNWRQVQGESQLLPLSQDKMLVHRVCLRQLEPGTRYSFKFDEASPVYQFETAPSTLEKPVLWVDGGDIYHDAEESVHKMHQAIAKREPLFAVLGGDLAYSFSSKRSKEKLSRWFTFLKMWKEEMRTKEGRLIPIVAVIGNHEVAGGYNQAPDQAPVYYALFPNAGHYVLDFGSWMSLFLLDTDHTHKISGGQALWHQKNLQERKNILWKFASYHVPAYPSYRSFNTKQSLEIRRSWVPLFEKFNLTVAFEHHDHTLKRTYPILRDKVDEKGVVYLGDGSWGITYPRRPENHWYIANAAKVQAVWLLELKSEQLNAKALSADGQIIDQVYIRMP